MLKQHLTIQESVLFSLSVLLITVLSYSWVATAHAACVLDGQGIEACLPEDLEDISTVVPTGTQVYNDPVFGPIRYKSSGTQVPMCPAQSLQDFYALNLNAVQAGVLTDGSPRYIVDDPTMIDDMQRFSPAVDRKGYFRIRSLFSTNISPNAPMEKRFFFFGDDFQIATPPLRDDVLTEHTKINDNYASVVNNLVRISREEWQNNHGLIVTTGPKEIAGNSDFFRVIANGPSRGARANYTAIGLSSTAASMDFKFMDPNNPNAILIPFSLRSDGTFYSLKRDASGNAIFNFYVRPSGRVGINTGNPATTLDVNGFMSIQPVGTFPACNAINNGTIILTTGNKLCACNGASWVNTADGVIACTIN